MDFSAEMDKPLFILRNADGTRRLVTPRQLAERKSRAQAVVDALLLGACTEGLFGRKKKPQPPAAPQGAVPEPAADEPFDAKSYLLSTPTSLPDFLQQHGFGPGTPGDNERAWSTYLKHHHVYIVHDPTMPSRWKMTIWPFDPNSASGFGMPEEIEGEEPIFHRLYQLSDLDQHLRDQRHGAWGAHGGGEVDEARAILSRWLK